MDKIDLSNWVIELKKIQESKERATVTRLLAAHLQMNPYMAAGDFFQSLSNNDLEFLVSKTEELSVDSRDAEDILLITMMLAAAEGSPAETMEELHNQFSSCCIFLAGTSLARKGLVTAFYQNMSFGEDMREATIFKAIEH